jgi:hypothetical protein
MTISTETIGTGVSVGEADLVPLDEAELQAAVARIRKELGEISSNVNTEDAPSTSQVTAKSLAATATSKPTVTTVTTPCASAEVRVVDSLPPATATKAEKKVDDGDNGNDDDGGESDDTVIIEDDDVDDLLEEAMSAAPTTTPPPATSTPTQAKAISREALERLRVACQRLRAMPVAERDALLKPHSLSEMTKGSLMEVTSVERAEGEHGKYAVLTYAMTDDEGVRKEGRVNVSATVAANPQLVAPCLCLFRGEKVSRNGRTFFDVLIARARPGTDREGLRKMADEFRKLSPRNLTARMSIQMLETFPDGTVFIFKDKKRRKLRQDSEPSMLVTYETVLEGETIEGVVIVPNRIEKDIDASGGTGVMIYLGRRTSAHGRVYNDVRVVHPEQVFSL